MRMYTGKPEYLVSSLDDGKLSTIKTSSHRSQLDCLERLSRQEPENRQKRPFFLNNPIMGRRVQEESVYGDTNNFDHL